MDLTTRKQRVLPGSLLAQSVARQKLLSPIKWHLFNSYLPVNRFAHLRSTLPPALLFT
jgi:hypothetical protein